MIDVNNLTIKTVIDNTASTPVMMAEWGLSIFIDTGEKKILFDTGAGNTDVLLNNLDALNIKVTDIDMLVLSHGHLDHTGGLRPFLEKRHFLLPQKDIEIICHPAAMDSQYVKNIGSFGCPYTKEELSRFGASFKLIREPYFITEDIIVSGEIPFTNDYESTGLAFFRQANSEFGIGASIIEEKDLGFKAREDKFVQDSEVIDDMALYIKTDKGLVIILGCAHRGTINTVEHAMKVLDSDNVYMVIGGTHTAGVSTERMDFTINRIKDIGIKKVGVSHCTGQVSGCILSNRLGRNIFFHNNAGSIIKFTNGEFSTNEF